MIQAVIFDIDNTLYSYNRASAIALDALAAYCAQNFSIDRRMFDKLYGEAIALIRKRTVIDCAANHNVLLRCQCILELLKVKAPAKAVRMYHIFWDTLLDHMEAEPGMLPLMQRFAKRHVRIGIGTDMTAYVQYQKLERLCVMDYVDQIITSEEAGVEKPARHFFDLCLEKMDCQPDECVFIGDSIDKDVKGAIRAGLHGVWYAPDVYASPQALSYPHIRSYEACIDGDGIVFGKGLVI